MRKLKFSFLALLLSFCCMNAYAQINLIEGYVITLQGDTIHGSIEYRSDNRNSSKCIFMADGTQDYKTFLPGEIYGYRFLDNGRFYVSKDVPMNGKTEKYFLEYVMRAQVSLYFLGNKLSGDYCFIETEEGELVPLMVESYTSNTEETAQRRERLAPAYQALLKSQSATNQLWRKEMNLKNITKIIQTYNDDVCPDGVCELFEYKNKKTPRNERPMHLVAAAGIDFMSVTFENILNKQHHLSTQSFDYVSPYAEIGFDCYLDRIYPGILLLGRATYHYTNTTITLPSGEDKELMGNTIGAKLAVGYQHKQWKFHPRAFAGITFNQLYCKRDAEIYYIAPKAFGKPGDAHLGAVVGGGVVYPMTKGALLLDATYEQSNGGVSNVKITDLSIKIGYQFW